MGGGGGRCGIGAEDYHVGEIAPFFCDLGGGWGGGFAEDAAGWEDGENCLHYNPGGGEEEVAGVVLFGCQHQIIEKLGKTHDSDYSARF